MRDWSPEPQRKADREAGEERKGKAERAIPLPCGRSLEVSQSLEA
jgi:hypothetical protein